VPDVDVLGFIWGIEYGHVLGHRGFMRSRCFALIVAVMTVVSGFFVCRDTPKLGGFWSSTFFW